MRAKLAGVDIKLLGGLFLIVGVVGLAVIVLFPSYALKLFGTTVTGPSSFLVTLHSPALHLEVEYGFFWPCLWDWGLSLAYTGFGIVSESMNRFDFGFHVFRVEFIATTALFVIYLFWRRHLFTDRTSVTIARPSVSEGSH